MELNEEQVQKILKQNSTTVPNWITKARDQSDKLFALIHGDQFIELLITQIEYIESKKKADARAKYSRNIVPFFSRILRPISNVYSANGGSIHFDIKDNKDKELLLKKLSRSRNGKSLRGWLKTFWMPLYHSDPNGVIFLEYSTEGKEVECWPTYKQISHIRAYEPKGQLVEWIMFEPRKVKIGNKIQQVIRFVDDKQDRTYLVKSGGNFQLIEELNGKVVTFEHPFGQVPAIINSDIEMFRGKIRLSPIDSIVDMSEEYARDQSVKTLYKKYMGFPKEWKYVDKCNTCQGAKRVDDEKCNDCDGHGHYEVNDVTDILTLAIPEGDEVKITPDVAGFVVPPLEIWKQYNEELKELSETAHATHWGTLAGFTSTVNKTATEAFLNTQPMSDKLNDLSDVAEGVENILINWIANVTIPTKVKDEIVASTNYGRRFIIDSPDAILDKYEKSKKEGDNNVILDRLFNEYLTSRYRRDPEFLRVILLKASVEPYLHLNLEQIKSIFGVLEAQKKVLFEDWWNMSVSEHKDKTSEALTKEFDKWFVDQQPEGEESDADTLSNQAKLRGSVGGVTGIVSIISAVSMGQMPVESAVSILEEIYGLSEDIAKEMIGNPKITPPAPSRFQG